METLNRVDHIYVTYIWLALYISVPLPLAVAASKQEISRQEKLTAPSLNGSMAHLFFKTFGVKHVANTAQAKKRARQAEKHRRHNMGLRSAVRTAIKKVVAATDAKKAQDAEAAYNAAVPLIDRMAGKGILHKNKAARHKSRLLTAIRKIAA